MRPVRPIALMTPSQKGAVPMRIILGVLVAAALCVPAAAQDKAPEHPKRHAKVVWRGYGFLPGYRPPEVIARERSTARTGVYFYGYPGHNFYGGPGFYRGRWNGGGFGACWIQTPIGPHWSCG
jgi:hypothetical protein